MSSLTDLFIKLDYVYASTTTTTNPFVQSTNTTTLPLLQAIPILYNAQLPPPPSYTHITKQKMALFQALCLLVLKFSFTNSAVQEVPNTSNEACIGTGGSFFLGIGIYTDRCPEAEAIIFSWVQKAVSEDPRMAASLLRLHFHDCFVNASA